MDKKVLIQFLDDTEQILQRNHILTEGFKEDFDSQRLDIKAFKAKILFVGGFSAGKSALLNTFLGEDEILEENISPETAIATELEFGTDEKVILIDKNGNKEFTDFEGVKSYSPQNYQKYIYVLDNTSLREFPNIILVDMPGFDSGIEAHNKALMQYIDEAAAYIFVIDAEKGTISQNSIQFLTEINNYSHFVSFIMTKCDKLIPSNVNEVKQNVEEILQGVINEEPDIMTTSSRYNGAGEKIKNLIRQFPVDDLMLQKIGGNVILKLRQSAQALQVQLDSLNFNSRDIDLAIQDRENQSLQLKNNMQNQKQNLSIKLQTENVKNIIADVESALENQVDSLVAAIQVGGDVFNERVNSILRTVLAESTQRNIETSYYEFIDDLGKYKVGDSINVADATDTIQRTVDALKNISQMGAKFAKMQKFNKAYKVFSTVGAVTTSIIAPWMELLIIFLPEIIGFVSTLIGSSKEEQLRSKIIDEVIPQICEKLRPEIKKSMHDVEQQMVEDIEKDFNTAIENEIEALEQLKEEKSKREFDVSSQREMLTNDIQKVNQMIQTISTALK